MLVIVTVIAEPHAVCDGTIWIAQMWQSARLRPTEKSYKKVFIFSKEACQLYDFHVVANVADFCVQ